MPLTHILRGRTQTGLKAKMNCRLREHTVPECTGGTHRRRLSCSLILVETISGHS